MYATFVRGLRYAAVLTTLTGVARCDETFEYETIRFFTKNSKPERLGAHAVSPDGRWLALSFESGIGSRSGVSIVDLTRKELVHQNGHFSFFSLAFSSDSQRILGIGDYAGVQVVDVATGAVSGRRNVPAISGRIGVDIDEKNGKLLITSITEGFNPTLGDQLRVGDEILAINEGEKSVRYDDRGEWATLAGKPLKDVLDLIGGKPGTWLQLRVARRGTSKRIEVSVQRQWPKSYNRRLPSHGESFALSLDRSVFQFFSADTTTPCAFTSHRDATLFGQRAISPNGQRYGTIAQVVNGSDYCVEVHNLQSGKLEQSSILEATNFRHLCFSPNSQQLLVGTRDSVEVFDIESAKWQAPVVLTPQTEADPGRVVTRRIPLGLGLPGDLYTTSPEVVYSKPAALVHFDVSPKGIIAVGSEEGGISLASLETKQRFGVVGDDILGTAPEMIEFTPTGKHLIAFADGVLSIIDFKEPSAMPNEENISTDVSRGK